MNLIQKVCLLAIFSILLVACGNKQEIKDLQVSTEKIHDDAMKEMADMNRVSRRLKKNLESLDSLSAERLKIMDALENMEKAEEGMMAWMTGYKEPGAEMPKEQALQYFQEQKALIEKNQKEIHEAYETAKNLIK